MGQSCTRKIWERRVRHEGKESHISNPELSHTALLIVDPQNDFLSEGGVMWDVVGERVKNTRVVAHLVELRNAANSADVPIFYSPHYYSDHEFALWRRRNVIDKLTFDRRKIRRPGWGADFHPDLAPDQRTLILSPHKSCSGFWEVDISIQFRQRGIETIVLAGASANLCMERHLRHAEDRGYVVLTVKDAATGPCAEEANAAMVNCSLTASQVVTTDQITSRLHEAAAVLPRLYARH